MGLAAPGVGVLIKLGKMSAVLTAFRAPVLEQSFKIRHGLNHSARNWNVFPSKQQDNSAPFLDPFLPTTHPSLSASGAVSILSQVEEAQPDNPIRCLIYHFDVPKVEASAGQLLFAGDQPWT